MSESSISISDKLKFARAHVVKRFDVDFTPAAAELRDVTQALTLNLDGVIGSLSLPINIVGVSTMACLMRYHAYSQLGLPITKQLTSEEENAVLAKANQLYDRASDDLLANAAKLTDSFNEAVANFNTLVDGWVGVNIEDKLRSILGGAVIGVWTAFEVLAEDLWIACVNSRLRLAFIAMGAEPAPGDDEPTLERKSKIVVSFPHGKLRDPTFDPRTQMGSLLKEKWKFSKRVGAADAYAKTFRDSEAELEAIFQDDRLQWLSTCRNALVHDAGIANLEFEKLMNRHPQLKDIKNGQKIPLNGPLVSSMIQIAIDKSVALLAFADKWLKNNPA